MGLIVVAAAASVAAVRQRPPRAQRNATKRQAQNGASLPPSTQMPTQSHDRRNGERTAGAPYRRRRHVHVIRAERSEIAMTVAHSLSAVACVTTAMTSGKPKNGVGVSVGVLHRPVLIASDAAI